LSAKTGLQALEDVEEISIVAVPGATFGYLGEYKDEADRIIAHVIAHAERMRYRIAVLDSGDGLDTSEVRAMRAKVESDSAALYYPWIRIRDPITTTDIDLPPSGFIAGIYSRNDIEKGVSKSPANQVVHSAIGLESLLGDAQQDALNAEGIDCLRTFIGRGVLVWGARTTSSDSEWKYVSVRRYLAYLEQSIDRGTQWTVFEPNGEVLWAAVRRSIEGLLLNEWRAGALMGNKPEMAFFVRCDRSTMTQNDLDNGRLICLIGVAPVRPAEFVIVRIGQWTADRRN
jgi:phage tail sheath protein FI